MLGEKAEISLVYRQVIPIITGCTIGNSSLNFMSRKGAAAAEDHHCRP